jgi:hypothetical protein
MLLLSNWLELSWPLGFLALTFIVYLIVNRILRPLTPALVNLEFATVPKQANAIREQWQDGHQIGFAVAAILMQNLLLIPLYSLTAVLLAYVFKPEGRVMEFLNWTLVLLVILVAAAHFLENAALLVTLIFRARDTVVFGTRKLAWFKYTVAALAMLYATFRGEAYLYVLLGHREPFIVAVLVVMTVAAGFVTARQLTLLSRDYPPLLALQLAPSRLAAKDILERWGHQGRARAGRALLLQTLFAVLCGLTLATFCARVHLHATVLDKIAQSFGWAVLAAAACHVAQNVGAFVAVRRRDMGWWVDSMRALGRARLVLLGVTALYFIALLIGWEWLKIVDAGIAIADRAPTLSLP